jgi:predicted DNA-binding ribbon-helix-helix protein
MYGQHMMDQLRNTKNTDVIKRSIFINGHKTSVSLENEFWQGLREIADHNHKRLAMLVEQIDRTRTTCNLSSAIRVFVFNHFRGEKSVTSENIFQHGQWHKTENANGSSSSRSKTPASGH